MFAPRFVRRLSPERSTARSEGPCVLHRGAPWIKNAPMKDARGLDVTSDDATAVAAADDFAARLLRLDQGVEAILDAVKRWPATPIVQLYAAAVLALRPDRQARATTPPTHCAPARRWR